MFGLPRKPKPVDEGLRLVRILRAEQTTWVKAGATIHPDQLVAALAHIEAALMNSSK